MPKISLIIWLLRLKIYPVNGSFNYLCMFQILTGVYLQCFTKIVVKKITKKLLTLAVVAYIFYRSGVEATDWFLNKTLKATWKIFDDSPARRNTYIKICKIDEFLPRYWFYVVSNHLSLEGKFQHPDITIYRGVCNFLSRIRGVPT